MALATIDDVALALGVPTPDPASIEAKQWQRWLDWAERQIVRRLGSVDTLNADDVAYVEAEAVALKVKRPDSATQVDVQVDDSRMSKRYESSTGQVTILDEWWAMLTPASTPTAFTIAPGGY